MHPVKMIFDIKHSVRNRHREKERERERVKTINFDQNKHFLTMNLLQIAKAFICQNEQCIHTISIISFMKMKMKMILKTEDDIKNLENYNYLKCSVNELLN